MMRSAPSSSNDGQSNGPTQRWSAWSSTSDPYLLSRSADGAMPCLPDGLTHAYSRLAAKTGVGGHFHQLRHYAATTSIAGGADVRTVAGRLGHADPSTTLRIYAHAVEARDRELAGVLGAAVLGSMNGSGQSDRAHPPAKTSPNSPGTSPRRSARKPILEMPGARPLRAKVTSQLS